MYNFSFGDGSPLFEYETGSGNTIYIEYIDAKGMDLDELIENCIIYTSTGRGNEGPDWTIGDYSEKIQDGIVEMFKQKIKESLK